MRPLHRAQLTLLALVAGNSRAPEPASTQADYLYRESIGAAFDANRPLARNAQLADLAP